ncbi:MULTISPECIES: ATP-binding protein [unclassified Pseudomonas]|uniref:HAMP domain-containing sensor histidine kinase n=1 Tax=unclassified Pseudomonas TaxID=196821 RepID=UPI000EA96F9A|nr:MULTISPECIES: ATP-binding protein [unclassified Pseudomonas]AYF86612.1 HAMP domain-containing protein [Pseudomonas sp. DY-1]MRK21803.1 HAMP domain-containing protein [Pseudomonas sp. JG-B]
MSALWRINLLVTLFFVLVGGACLALLLRQAGQDVRRELMAAEAVVEYLRDSARRDPAALQPHLTGNLRHVRVHRLDQPSAEPAPGPLQRWLAHWLYPAAEASGDVLSLVDGSRVRISVDPRDEVDEIRDSLQQLLVLFAIALCLSLWAIRWAVRRGLRVLDELLGALQQVSRGDLQARLPAHSSAESQRLAGHFNQMAACLERVKVENAELTQALLALQERERRQLAQALHDDLGQYLAGIRAQLFLLRSVTGQLPVVNRTAQALENNCQHLQDGFRALVRDLYPVVLERLELAEAIRLLGQQWQEAHGISCRMQLADDLPALSGEAKAHLYRLLQEALTNVVRHAGASEVRIRLRTGQRRLRLVVRDDGRGAESLGGGGIGLRSMRERARCLGGELRLLTRPGAGLVLCLNIPLEEPGP